MRTRFFFSRNAACLLQRLLRPACSAIASTCGDYHRFGGCSGRRRGHPCRFPTSRHLLNLAQRLPSTFSDRNRKGILFTLVSRPKRTRCIEIRPWHHHVCIQPHVPACHQSLRSAQSRKSRYHRVIGRPSASNVERSARKFRRGVAMGGRGENALTAIGAVGATSISTGKQ